MASFTSDFEQNRRSVINNFIGEKSRSTLTCVTGTAPVIRPGRTVPHTFLSDSLYYSYSIKEAVREGQRKSQRKVPKRVKET